MASIAEQLLSLYQQGGWSYVDRHVQDGFTESLHVDFKLKKNRAAGSFDRDDRKHLGEALSGFANSEGGLLVWGIDARRVGDEDKVVGLQPLEDIRGVLSQLAQLTPEMVSPAVLGVQHVPVHAPAESNKGIIITLVPESDLTPHMARGPGQHRYYRRTQSSFRPLEHYEIADLFGRRAHPVLSGRATWKIQMYMSGGGGATARLHLQFVIENQGRGLAMYPSLALAKPSGWSPSEWTGKHGGSLPLRIVHPPSGWWLRYAGGADTVIYPEDEFLVTSIAFDIRNQRVDFPNLRIAYRIIAAEAQPFSSEFFISGHEIWAAASKLFAEAGFPHCGEPPPGSPG